MAKLTPEIEEDFIDCLKNFNWSNKELAKLFEVSEQTVKRWIDKSGLHKHAVDGRKGLSKFNKKDRNTQIYEAYWKTNKSLGQISKEYKVSRQRVFKIIKTTEKLRKLGLL